MSAELRERVSCRTECTELKRSSCACNCHKTASLASMQEWLGTFKVVFFLKMTTNIFTLAAMICCFRWAWFSFILKILWFLSFLVSHSRVGLGPAGFWNMCLLCVNHLSCTSCWILVAVIPALYGVVSFPVFFFFLFGRLLSLVPPESHYLYLLYLVWLPPLFVSLTCGLLTSGFPVWPVNVLFDLF